MIRDTQPEEVSAKPVKKAVAKKVAGTGVAKKAVAKKVAAAKVEAQQQALRARESLREQVAVLAVKGAEQILRKEVNAGVHADLLGRLKAEL